MKKILLYVLFYLTSFFSLQSHAETLKVAFFNAPLHIYSTSENHLEGATYHYVNDIAKAMNLKVEWVGPIPFARLIRLLQEGSVDAGVLLSRKAERETYLLFPSYAYVSTPGVMLLNQNHPLNKISSIEDLKGIQLTYLKDAIMPQFLQEHRDLLTINELSGTNWLKQGLKQLVIGRTEGVIEMNHLSPLKSIHELNLESDVKMIPLPGEPNKMYFAFAKNAAKGQLFFDLYNQVSKLHNKNYADYIAESISR